MTAARDAVPAARLLGHRTRSRAGSLLALVVTIAVALGLVCGLTAVAALASEDSLRTALPDPATPDGWLQVQTRPAADREAQQQAATALLAELFGDTVAVETLTVGEAGTDFERVAWRVTPAAEALTPAGVARLAAGLERMPEEFRSSPAAQNGSIATGALPAAVAGLATASRATAAIMPVPIALLGVLGWFAALQLARLLGAARDREARLLRARGLSRSQENRLAVLDALGTTVPGALLGLGAAAGVLALVWGAAGPAALAEAWPVAAALTLVLAVTVAVGQPAASRTAVASGRLARAASPALAVLLVAVGAVLVWQAATTPGTAWDAWAVTVSVLAPTVGVAALAVLALALFGPVAAVTATVAARGRRLSPGYPARQVARRVTAFSVAVALVVIAMAGATLASAYAGTWATTTAQSQRLVAGAPLRAAVDPATPETLQQATGAVTAAAPAYVDAVIAGDIAASIVAVPTATLAAVTPDLPDLAASLAQTLPDDPQSIELAADATGIRLTGTLASAAPDAAAAVGGRAWVMDATGTPASVVLDVAVAADGTFTATGDLPPGTAPWRLTAVEVAQGDGQGDATIIFTGMQLFAMTGTAAVALDATLPPSATLNPPRGAVTAVRSVLVWSAAGAAAARIPVVVTDAFATPLAAAAGAELDLVVDGSGRRFAVVVADVVPALPGIGSGPGVFASLVSLVEGSTPLETAGELAPSPPAADEVWAAGDAAALAGALGVPVAVPADPAEAVAAELATLWRAAAVGGAALAGVALVAFLWALAGRRAGEVLALRALGVEPRAQARLRAVESGLVIVLAAVLGVSGGLALAAVLVPRLVTRTIPDIQVAPTFVLDPVAVVATAGVLLVAFLVAAAGTAAAVRTQGGSTRVEEAAP